MTRSPNWQLYERLVARMMADQLPTAYCVTPNARVVGRISGRSRQIDVLVDLRHDSDNSRRLVVDAKRRRRRITINDVEAFRGLMEDVGATHGYLVCPRGHTKGAERRAAESFHPSRAPRLPGGIRSVDLAGMRGAEVQQRTSVLGWIPGTDSATA